MIERGLSPERKKGREREVDGERTKAVLQVSQRKLNEAVSV
jgi:hypothetical protein